MNISITEMTAKVTPVSGQHENLLANATLTFRGELGEYFTISGFTIWKSKFGGLNVEVPKKRNFKYCLFEKSLFEKIKKVVLKQYEYANIPIVQNI